MTNEELAVRIKQGERDKLEELWNQVERFIWKMANRRAYSLEGRNGVTAEDLYQAGYLAMVDAVGRFFWYNRDKVVGKWRTGKRMQEKKS